MPKFVREQDRNRFRIVPVGKYFHIEERTSFFGLWDRWKIIKRYGEYALTVRYFNNVEEAKSFIEEFLKREEEVKFNESGGVIYYP